MTINIEKAARSYVQSGLNVIPCLPTEKKPAVASWSEYQSAKVNPNVLWLWFQGERRIAIICGAISGNLEMIDFDDGGSAFERFKERVGGGILDRIIIERTPRGGYHLIYRCSDAVIPGNQKLAVRAADKQVLIETRGEGGYFLCAPNDGYRITQGELNNVPDIPAEWREKLHWAARQLNEVVEVEKPQRQSLPSDAQDSPAEEYNKSHSFRDLLEKHGWRYKEAKGDCAFYLRPGKDKGEHSASVKADEVLYVYSTNAHPFKAERGYSKFDAFAILEHGGDLSAASKAVLKSRPVECKYRPVITSGFGAPVNPESQQGTHHTEDGSEKPVVSASDPVSNPAELWRAQLKARQAAEEWPDIQDVNDILENPPERPQELIKGICFVRSKISMSGPSKAKKTFFQIYTSACVATGAHWFGYEVMQGSVLYINFELLAWTFQNRSDLILKKMGMALEPGQFDVWHLRGKRVTIEKLETELLRRIDKKQYSLIVFDPLYKILGTRSENDASEMGDLLGRLEAIAHDANAAYLVAHHFSKGNAASKNTIDRSAGSGVVARDGDAIVTLSPHEDAECMTMECTVRDMPPAKDLVLRWRYPCFEIDGTLNPKALQKPGPELAALTVQDILSVMSDEFKSRDKICYAAKQKTGRGINAVIKVFNDCEERGLIRVRTLERVGTRPVKVYALGEENK